MRHFKSAFVATIGIFWLFLFIALTLSMYMYWITSLYGCMNIYLWNHEAKSNQKNCDSCSGVSSTNHPYRCEHRHYIHVFLQTMNAVTVDFLKAYTVNALSKLTGCLMFRISHSSSRRLHLILTSTSNNPHLLVCLAHLVYSSSFHYNKPCCYANIDMLEVPEQIEALLAKAVRHLSKLSVHIRCETTVAISLQAMRICAAARIMAVAHTL